MGVKRVKLKPAWRLGAVAFALGCFVASLSGWIPPEVVEHQYSRGIFPSISSILAPAAAGFGFSWIDVLLPVIIAGVLYGLWRGRFLAVANLAAALYLFFFWTWGLNYQRQPLVEKLDFAGERVTGEAVDALRREAAAALNALYPERFDPVWETDDMDALAASAIARTVRELEGIDWPATARVKSSVLLNPVFQAAGVEGMFNPFGHEPLITAGLLPIERPMVVMHELAHVRGYPDEGDANFVALMAGLHASHPRIRYSGWMFLWLYLRTPAADGLLDEGPREDLDAIFERMRRARIDWVSRVQTETLDLYLKANRVDDGVESYSRIVELAVGTRPSWDRFGPW